MSLFALCYGGDFWILSMAFLKGGESSEGWDGVRWCSSVCYHRKVIISGCQWNFTAVSSIGGSIKLCSTLFFWKAPETGIWCGTGSFHCKCHGMFVSVALFLSVDGRKEWWAKHGGKKKKGNYNKHPITFFNISNICFLSLLFVFLKAELGVGSTAAAVLLCALSLILSLFIWYANF